MEEFYLLSNVMGLERVEFNNKGTYNAKTDIEVKLTFNKEINGSASSLKMNGVSCTYSGKVATCIVNTADLSEGDVTLSVSGKVVDNTGSPTEAEFDEHVIGYIVIDKDLPAGVGVDVELVEIEGVKVGYIELASSEGNAVSYNYFVEKSDFETYKNKNHGYKFVTDGMSITSVDGTAITSANEYTPGKVKYSSKDSVVYTIVLDEYITVTITINVVEYESEKVVFDTPEVVGCSSYNKGTATCTLAGLEGKSITAKYLIKDENTVKPSMYNYGGIVDQYAVDVKDGSVNRNSVRVEGNGTNQYLIIELYIIDERAIITIEFSNSGVLETAGGRKIVDK